MGGELKREATSLQAEQFPQVKAQRREGERREGERIVWEEEEGRLIPFPYAPMGKHLARWA